MSARACCLCRHYLIRDGAAYCRHPAYRIPTPWAEAIRPGQPCGQDNAPLFEPGQSPC